MLLRRPRVGRRAALPPVSMGSPRHPRARRTFRMLHPAERAGCPNSSRLVAGRNRRGGWRSSNISNMRRSCCAQTAAASAGGSGRAEGGTCRSNARHPRHADQTSRPHHRCCCRSRSCSQS
eukprot:scaffold293_cov121-Isochrysis_galbana.AAC.3